MTSNPTPRSPDDDRDFQQFTGVFDRPIAPCPAFAERLRQQAIAASSKERENTMHQIAMQPTPPAPEAQHRATPIPAGRPSGGRIIEIIAAAVLVVALLGSMLWMDRLQNGPSNPGPDPNGQRLAAVTSPMASATPGPNAATEPSWSDPGHTNAYPAGFDPQTAQPAEPIGELKFNSDTGVIVGDTLILSGRPIGTDPEDVESYNNFMGVDLKTGEELWTRHRAVMQMPISGPDAMYTIEISSGGNKNINFMLVSVSPENGLPNWGHTFLTISEDQFLNTSVDLALMLSTPIVIGDAVYVATADGKVTAYDTDSGALIWETSRTDSDHPVSPSGVSLVGNDQHIYVVDNENRIVKRDRVNGEIVETFQTNGSASDERLTLMLDGDVLVVLSQQRYYQEPVIPRLEAFSASGELLWQTQISDVSGSPAITNGIIGIPQIPNNNSGSSTTPITAMFFDLESGELLGHVPAPNWGGASVSASGAVICVHGTSPQLTCSDTALQESGPQTIDVGAQYTAEGPPSSVLFWNSNAIVLGHEGGPYIIRSGDQPTHESMTEIATPAPSPMEARATPQSSPKVSAVQEDATPTASPEPTNGKFQPDYQSTGTLSVNLRWGPGIRYGVVTTVSPETPLQYLGESEPTRHPEEDGLTDDQQWMKVRTRSGDEGWIREVDIIAYTP